MGLTFTVTTYPAHGDLFVRSGHVAISAGTPFSDPAIVYEPDSGYVGKDSFVWHCTNETGAGAPATVQLQIYAVRDVPTPDTRLALAHWTFTPDLNYDVIQKVRYLQADTGDSLAVEDWSDLQHGTVEGDDHQYWPYGVRMAGGFVYFLGVLVENARDFHTRRWWNPQDESWAFFKYDMDETKWGAPTRVVLHPGASQRFVTNEDARPANFLLQQYILQKQQGKLWMMHAAQEGPPNYDPDPNNPFPDVKAYERYQLDGTRDAQHTWIDPVEPDGSSPPSQYRVVWCFAANGSNILSVDPQYNAVWLGVMGDPFRRILFSIRTEQNTHNQQNYTDIGDMVIEQIACDPSSGHIFVTGWASDLWPDFPISHNRQYFEIQEYTGAGKLVRRYRPTTEDFNYTGEGSYDIGPMVVKDGIIYWSCYMSDYHFPDSTTELADGIWVIDTVTGNGESQYAYRTGEGDMWASIHDEAFPENGFYDGLIESMEVFRAPLFILTEDKEAVITNESGEKGLTTEG